MLRNLYTRFFESGHDEMDLQRARVAGRLYDYFSELFDDIPVSFAAILRNPHSLSS